MKFCYNIGENEDKSKQLCKYRENIFEKMHVARKQLHAFSSCVRRGFIWEITIILSEFVI